MSKPEDVYFSRKMVRKIRGKKEPIVVAVPDKYTPAQKKGMRAIKTIEERDPLALNYLKKKYSTGTTKEKLKETNKTLQQRGKDLSDILKKKRQEAEARKEKEVVLPPEFIKLIESLKPGAKKKLSLEQLAKQEEERKNAFRGYNKVFDRIAKEKLPQDVIKNFRMAFINLQSNEEKMKFLRDLLASKDLKKLFLTDREKEEVKIETENALREETNYKIMQQNRLRQQKGLEPLPLLELLDLPPPLLEEEPAQAPTRTRRRQRTRPTSTTETEDSEDTSIPPLAPITETEDSEGSSSGLESRLQNIRRELASRPTDFNELDNEANNRRRISVGQQPITREDFDAFTPAQKRQYSLEVYVNKQYGPPSLNEITIPFGSMVGEGLMPKRKSGRPRKNAIKGAGFFDDLGDLVKKGLSSAVSYVKENPEILKKGFEYGKKGYEMYKNRKKPQETKTGGALLNKPSRGQSTYQSYF